MVKIRVKRRAGVCIKGKKSCKINPSIRKYRSCVSWENSEMGKNKKISRDKLSQNSPHEEMEGNGSISFPRCRDESFNSKEKTALLNSTLDLLKRFGISADPATISCFLISSIDSEHDTLLKIHNCLTLALDSIKKDINIFTTVSTYLIKKLRIVLENKKIFEQTDILKALIETFMLLFTSLPTEAWNDSEIDHTFKSVILFIFQTTEEISQFSLSLFENFLVNIENDKISPVPFEICYNLLHIMWQKPNVCTSSRLLNFTVKLLSFMNFEYKRNVIKIWISLLKSNNYKLKIDLLTAIYNTFDHSLQTQKVDFSETWILFNDLLPIFPYMRHQFVEVESWCRLMFHLTNHLLCLNSNDTALILYDIYAGYTLLLSSPEKSVKTLGVTYLKRLSEVVRTLKMPDKVFRNQTNLKNIFSKIFRFLFNLYKGNVEIIDVLIAYIGSLGEEYLDIYKENVMQIYTDARLREKNYFKELVKFVRIICSENDLKDVFTMWNLNFITKKDESLSFANLWLLDYISDSVKKSSLDIFIFDLLPWLKNLQEHNFKIHHYHNDFVNSFDINFIKVKIWNFLPKIIKCCHDPEKLSIIIDEIVSILVKDFEISSIILHSVRLSIHRLRELEVLDSNFNQKISSLLPLLLKIYVGEVNIKKDLHGSVLTTIKEILPLTHTEDVLKYFQKCYHMVAVEEAIETRNSILNLMAVLSSALSPQDVSTCLNYIKDLFLSMKENRFIDKIYKILFGLINNIAMSSEALFDLCAKIPSNPLEQLLQTRTRHISNYLFSKYRLACLKKFLTCQNHISYKIDDFLFEAILGCGCNSKKIRTCATELLSEIYKIYEKDYVENVSEEFIESILKILDGIKTCDHLSPKGDDLKTSCFHSLMWFNSKHSSKLNERSTDLVISSVLKYSAEESPKIVKCCFHLLTEIVKNSKEEYLINNIHRIIPLLFSSFVANDGNLRMIIKKIIVILISKLGMEIFANAVPTLHKRKIYRIAKSIKRRFKKQCCNNKNLRKSVNKISKYKKASSK